MNRIVGKETENKLRISAGEDITIHIAINNKSIMHFSARRITSNLGEMCTYRTNDGQLIKHRPIDGALVLAKKMMRKWKVKQ